jgi:hypothetical protein
MIAGLEEGKENVGRQDAKEIHGHVFPATSFFQI